MLTGLLLPPFVFSRCKSFASSPTAPSRTSEMNYVGMEFERFQRRRALYARELNASRFFCHVGRPKTHGRKVGEQRRGRGS